MKANKFTVVALVSCIWAPVASAQHILAPPDPAALEAARTASSLPHQFAIARDLGLDTSDAGQWSMDRRIWTLDLVSPGAHSLSLHLDRYNLPPGATLLISDAQGQVTHGPYRDSDGRDGALWTPLVFGERIGLTLKLPAAGQHHALRVARLHHGYDEPHPARAKRLSGSCNNDVVCPIGDPWRDQIDSTVFLQIGGTGGCTGSLINNTRRDRTPYILTADHCQIEQGNNAASVVVYYRYQSSVCGQDQSDTPNPQFSQVGGVQVLANSFTAGKDNPDFTLLIVGSRTQPQIPPANFNPYWSGWDRRATPPASGATIHHPNTDEKSISIFGSTAAAEKVDIGVGADVLAWQVTWDDGTTEVGSSGAGLWNQDKRLVGQLAGGTASCANQQDPDYYGRFDLSWEWEPTLARQLRPWLDPDCQNPSVLDGITTAAADSAATPASAARDAMLCTGNGGGGGSGGGSSGGGGGGFSWLFLLIAALSRAQNCALRRHPGS